MSIVSAGLLSGGWIVLIIKIVRKKEPLKTKLAKLAIAALQLASVVTSGVARYYYIQLTTRSGVLYQSKSIV